MADGSVIINTKLDNKQAQRDLNRLRKEISSLEAELSDNATKKSAIEEKLNRAKKAAYDTADYIAYAQKELAKTTAATGGNDPFSEQWQKRIADANKELEAQDATVQKLDIQYTAISDKIGAAKDRLRAANEQASEASAALVNSAKSADNLNSSIKNTAGGAKEMSSAAEEASKRMDKFTNRIKVLARRVLVFSLITKALRSLKDYMWSAIQTNQEAMASVARLKGALMTLAQPIVNVVIPAFTLLVDVITRVVNAVSRLLSMLFGTTAEESAKVAESLYKQQKALKGVGGTAQKAGKSLAAFDEINQLTSDKSSGAGGASAGAASATTPNFKDMVSSSLSALLELFTGAALLSLGAILAFSGAHIPLGLSLMALGALAMWDAFSENWGAIKPLLQGAVGGALAITGTVLLIFGALLAFSGASVSLGIGMMLAGAIGLATATAANWDSMKDTLATAIGKVVTVIGASLLAIGAILTFSGVKIALGIGMMIAGAAALAVGSAALNWDTITSNVRTAVGKLLQIVGTSLLVLGLLFVLTAVNIPLGIGMMLAGGAALGVSAVVLNWDAIREKFAEVWNNIKQWWNSNCAKFFTREYWENLGHSIIDGLLNGLKKAFETVKTWVSNAGNWVKSKFSGASNAPTANVYRQSASFPVAVNSIPALAKGAVIPPNREFMAVLGDQKSGTNIETPLETMVQAFKQALSESGYGGGKIIENVLTLDGEVIYRNQKNLTKRMGVNIAEV